MARIDAARLPAFKEQQILVRLVQQLSTAQFREADARRSDRLWQEAAQLNLDPERVTHLLYAGVDMDDRAALLALDRAWCEREAASRPRRWAPARWWQRSRVKPQPCGGRRSAPPAAPRSHQGGR